jgi:hypothetical protein
MAIKYLAEAIILQSIEDLWNRQQEKDCVAFFEGEGFHLCAGMAGINMFYRRRLLKLISTSIRRELDCMESMQEDAIEYSLGRR